MSARHNNLKQILESNEWTEEQRQWLADYLDSNDPIELEEIMFDKLRLQLAEPNAGLDKRSAEDLEIIYDRIGIRPRKAKLVALWTKVAAAACIAALLVSVFLYRNKTTAVGPEQSDPKDAVVTNKDAAPGKNKATLVLADGAEISLDDAQNGDLTQQGGTKVLKFDGKVSYQSGSSTAKEVLYNSITTPRGGQYQVTLPDGTQVWLNAASSIRFPTVFAGKERRVEVTGEAYFEVTKNTKMPFVVQLQRSEVRVLGTHFNIMAYEDEESQRTTLLEGSIKFVTASDSNLLRPGEQSQLTRDGRVVIRENTDLEAVMAWKNGVFHFEKADIQTVMRQLSRWYDVDVVYQELPVKGLFHADIPKNTNLSVALQALNLTGKVHFQIENKKVIVMP